MVVQTKALGPVSVEENRLIFFPNGLYGFENTRHYALIGEGKNTGNPFMWLQCAEDRNVCFAVADAMTVFSDYVPEIGGETLEELGFSGDEKPRFLIIAMAPEGTKNLYFNLKSPIVINNAKRLARQIILEDDRYPIRYYIRGGEA